MQALLSVRPGGPASLQLGQLADPLPGPEQVRVRVAACAVNYPDVLIIEDRYQDRPARPFSPGFEVAGTVDAVGEHVDNLHVGDRVFGLTGNQGGMAEKVNLAARDCFVAPPELPLEEAAALLMTYGTVLYALQDRGNLRRNQTLLVLGAAGGIGLAAIELGKVLGARVVAMASSAQKLDLARHRGADACVLCPNGGLDHETAKALSREIKIACGTHGADVICDPVGGPYTEPALRAVAPGGRYLVVGFTAGIPRIPLNLVLLKSCQIIGVLWGAFVSACPLLYRCNVTQLLEWYREGRIRPCISARYPLARAPEALACLAERRALGKIIVTIGQHSGDGS